MVTTDNTPQRILGMWTGIETMLTWIIAAHITANDPARFSLFMQYCADNVNSKDKIRMFREVISQTDLTSQVDGRVFDGLNLIVEVRNEVAHSTAVRVPSTGEVAWIKLKRGLPTQITPEALEEKVSRAEQAREPILAAIGLAMDKVGFDLHRGWDASPRSDTPGS